MRFGQLVSRISTILVLTSMHIQAAQSKIKAKSGANLLRIDDYCQNDADCESKVCCPTIGNPHIKKMCHTNCTYQRVAVKADKYECLDEVFNNKKYKFCRTPEFSWFQAMTKCCNWGGQLASVNSQAEHDFIFALGRKLKPPIYNFRSIWVGGSRITSSSLTWAMLTPQGSFPSYLWSKVPGYFPTPSDGPNSYSCTLLTSDTGRYGLWPKVCIEPWTFVCVGTANNTVFE